MRNQLVLAVLGDCGWGAEAHADEEGGSRITQPYGMDCGGGGGICESLVWNIICSISMLNERAIVNQTNTGTVVKAMLGTLLRGTVVRLGAFPCTEIPSWSDLNWTVVDKKTKRVCVHHFACISKLLYPQQHISKGVCMGWGVWEVVVVCV